MYINQEIFFFPILSQIKPEILFSLSSHTFNWSQRLPRFPTFASHSLLSPRSLSSLQQSHQTFGDIQLVLSTIMTNWRIQLYKAQLQKNSRAIPGAASISWGWSNQHSKETICTRNSTETQFKRKRLQSLLWNAINTCSLRNSPGHCIPSVSIR